MWPRTRLLKLRYTYGTSAWRPCRPAQRQWAGVDPVARSDIDTGRSKAMLGQESARQAIANAAAKVNHDIQMAG